MPKTVAKIKKKKSPTKTSSVKSTTPYKVLCTIPETHKGFISEKDHKSFVDVMVRIHSSELESAARKATIKTCIWTNFVWIFCGLLAICYMAR